MAQARRVHARPDFALALTGIPGDVLIARRARSVCLVCGLTPVVAPNAGASLPWVCARCDAARPKPRRFNQKAEHARGLDNLDRLLKGE